MRKNVPSGPNEKRETYLEAIRVRMVGTMSVIEVHETMLEMRSHIDATAAAYEEIGLDPSAAMDAALEKFGQPGQIGADVATACKQKLNPGIGIAVFHTMAVQAVFGSAILIGFDYGLSQRVPNSVPNYWVDIVVGSAAGSVIGAIAWLAPFKPRWFAVSVCVMLNALLAFTIYPSYLSTDQFTMAIGVGLVLSAGVYFLAWNGARMARKAVARLSDDLPGPMKHA